MTVAAGVIATVKAWSAVRLEWTRHGAIYMQVSGRTRWGSETSAR